MTDLLPCPFCKLKAGLFVQEIVDGNDMTTAAYVKCDACEAQGPECRAVADAEAMWNKAPQPLSVAQGSRPRDFLSWAIEMFGPVAKLRSERLLRFVEEAIELAHAEGMEREVFNRVADRVYSRPAGDTPKEIGQAQACLETFAENIGLSSAAEAQREWERVQSIPQEEWTRRHSAKQALGIALPSTHQNTPTTHDQQEK